MQSYTEIPTSTRIQDSLAPILNNDKSIMSNHSGTAFPTVNLQVGMLCWRSDQLKLYMLTAATPTWTLLVDLNRSLAYLDSPTFTGTPLAPTATAATVTTQIATTAFVDRDFLKKSDNLGALASVPTARTNLGLGSAAVLTAGTAANNAVQLDGSAKLPAVDGSQLTNITTIPTGKIGHFAQRQAPAGWLNADGTAVSRTTYAALFAALVVSGTATVSVATPGVVTQTGHGALANDPMKFTTTGALPTGLTAGTKYYVVGASITANTYQLSLAPGGAAINTTGTQSGVHTAICAPYGDGDGSTTFNTPDLRAEFIRGLDAGRGVDVNRSRGQMILDAIQGHWHNFINHDNATGNSVSGGGSSGAYGSGGWVGDPVTDGVNGTPRTAAETRPRSVALLTCIKT